MRQFTIESRVQQGQLQLNNIPFADNTVVKVVVIPKVPLENLSTVAPIAPKQPFEQPRRPGALAGRLKIADDFDAPLPDSIASAFRGEQA
ncbi:MAG TPA: hypothetical protein ENG03_00785 [Thioploca sp.]|nr:MAG: hypothetical protein B6247_02090 [Beggiatoa sp. 4572_84]RKZ46874.1 MAG: hypothetical protein DRR08_32935 [Gammaproteobacteria bacterium]HDN25636.1 hypothetical protein [Thioploca sp.]